MKRKFEIRIIRKLNINNFNEMQLNLKDINPKIKIAKRRYVYPLTTSSH